MDVTYCEGLPLTHAEPKSSAGMSLIPSDGSNEIGGLPQSYAANNAVNVAYSDEDVLSMFTDLITYSTSQNIMTEGHKGNACIRAGVSNSNTQWAKM